MDLSIEFSEEQVTSSSSTNVQAQESIVTKQMDKINSNTLNQVELSHEDFDQLNEIIDEILNSEKSSSSNSPSSASRMNEIGTETPSFVRSDSSSLFAHQTSSDQLFVENFDSEIFDMMILRQENDPMLSDDFILSTNQINNNSNNSLNYNMIL